MEQIRERRSKEVKTVAERAEVAAKRAAGAKVAAAGVAVVAIRDYDHTFYFKRHFHLTFHPAFNHLTFIIHWLCYRDYNFYP